MKEIKENLIKRVAELENMLEERVDYSERVRREFAKTFHWYKERKQFDYGETEVRLPSWEEIFVELGKTLAARNFMDFEGNISELECKIEDLENKIRKEIHPNL